MNLRDLFYIAGISAGSLAYVLFLQKPAQADCTRWHPHHCGIEDVREEINRGPLDSTPFDPDTWNPIDWINSGAGELCEANARITAERNRDRAQGLSRLQKRYLRPYYGSLVDNVTVIWGSLLNDDLSFQGQTITLGSNGQAYGHTIYIRERRQSNSTEQLILLAHELRHVQQYRGYGDIDTFCREYLAEYWANGYENSRFEREAFEAEYSFADNLVNQLALDDQEPFNSGLGIYYQAPPRYRRGETISLPSTLPSYMYFRNNCQYPVRLRLFYMNYYISDWEDAKWWNFDGGEDSYLSHQGRRLMINFAPFFYYAEITDGPHSESYSWSGDAKISDGQFRQVDELNLNDDGDVMLSLNCNNI